MAQQTGESPESILETGVRLYERHLNIQKRLKVNPDDSLAKILQDPYKEVVYREIMQALAHNRAQSLSAADRKRIASEGGHGKKAKREEKAKKE